MDKRKFYKTFFGLYISLVLQNVITLSVNLTDNIMLGAYSEVALSGVTAANQVQFIFQMVMNSFGEGIVILGSQYLEKNKTEQVRRIAGIAMRFGLSVALLLSVLISLFPAQTIGLFTTDADIIREGSSYLGIIRFTYLFFAITQILLAILRTEHIVSIAFKLSLMTFFVNCGINYVLIFGHFGAPELGTAGAAVGTLTARILEVVVLVIYLAKKHTKIAFKPVYLFRRDKVLFADYMHVMGPMLFTNGLWGINTSLQTAILGHMTAGAIAANSAASNLYMLVKSASYGAASAAGVMIGQAVGSGDMDRIKSEARQLQKTFVCIGSIAAILLFFLRIPVLSLYDLQPETLEMANIFLIILCVIELGMAYQMPTSTGIIRGGGDTKFVVIMDLISNWCIVLPLSFVMAFVVQAPPAVVVFFLNSDQLFKCIPAYVRCNSWKWVRQLTR